MGLFIFKNKSREIKWGSIKLAITFHGTQTKSRFFSTNEVLWFIYFIMKASIIHDFFSVF